MARSDAADAIERLARQDRAFAHRGDRRHRRRAQARIDAREERHEDSGRERDDGCARLEDEARVGEREADRVEELEEALREQEAEEESDDRREDADDERLDDDRAEDLPVRRADRPQRRELPRPLRDRDRERVRDDERADEERDPAEREQEPARKEMNVVRCRPRPRTPARCPSSPAPSGGRIASISRTSCASGTSGFAATAISSSCPGFLKSRCAVGRSKPASVAPPMVRPELNWTMPETRRCCDRALGLHADRLPDREVLLRSGLLVDHDLVRLRPRALDAA